MEINTIIKGVNDVANKYDLQKVNLALIFKNRRLYGFDSEGGKYHCHPLDAPDEHIFVDGIKSIEDFVQESMRFLEEKEIL